MEAKTSDSQKQMIKITNPSKEDIVYANKLLEKGAVEKKDLRPNMSILELPLGLENQNDK